jgi:putative membrane protein
MTRMILQSSLLMLLGGFYTIGLMRLRARLSWRLPLAPVAAFIAGWLALVVAFHSPLDRIAEQRFWAHMVQHELLMVIAAPLLVLARPLAVMLWAIPQKQRDTVAHVLRAPALRDGWVLISAPFAAWTIHAAALWIWHAPALFDAALQHTSFHVAQHMSFFGSALLFWWALIHGRRASLRRGAALLYVLTTGMHNSSLGALLTFSSQPWYAIQTRSGSLTPLEDQQLGGLLMWVAAGTVLLAIAAVLLIQWLRECEQRVRYSRAAMVQASSGELHA